MRAVFLTHKLTGSKCGNMLLVSSRLSSVARSPNLPIASQTLATSG